MNAWFGVSWESRLRCYIFSGLGQGIWNGKVVGVSPLDFLSSGFNCL
jgi:hypothetical protein